MKLLPFIAAVVGSFCFEAHSLANEQDQIYLVLMSVGTSITPIPVKDLNQCEEQGAKFLASSRARPNGPKWFECIEGIK